MSNVDRSLCWTRRFLLGGLICLCPTLTLAQHIVAETNTQLIGLLPGLIGGDAASDFNRAVVSHLSTFPHCR